MRNNLPLIHDKPIYSRAVYAFSADPITYGHINLVERISINFQEVIVGIGKNPLKNYTFSLSQRLALAKQALNHLPNVTVVAFRGMVVDFALARGANIIVKGVRNAADFDYEKTHHLVGLSQQARIDTHILFADPKFAHVSSSTVKAIQSENGSLTQYVPLIVKSALEQKISRQLVIGVTGEIATGKSTLSDQLSLVAKHRKIPLHHIDIDKLGHQLIEEDNSQIHIKVQQLLIKQFGQDILQNDKICREKIASIIFNDAKKLANFNQIMRPSMTTLIRQELVAKRGIILIDGAYLVEANWLALSNNQVILTHAASDVQNQRLRNRGYSQQQLEGRKHAQLGFVKKKKSINDRIHQHRYGHLWHHNTTRNPDTNSATKLLDQIIDDCGADELFEELANAQ